MKLELNPQRTVGFEPVQLSNENKICHMIPSSLFFNQTGDSCVQAVASRYRASMAVLDGIHRMSLGLGPPQESRGFRLSDMIPFSFRTANFPRPTMKQERKEQWKNSRYPSRLGQHTLHSKLKPFPRGFNLDCRCWYKPEKRLSTGTRVRFSACLPVTSHPVV